MLKNFFKQKFNKKIVKIYPLTLAITALVTVLQIKYFKQAENEIITNTILALYLIIPFSAKFEGVSQYKTDIFKKYYILVILNLGFLYLYIDKIVENEKILSLFLLGLFYIVFFFLTPSKGIHEEKSNSEHFVKTLSCFINSSIFSIVLYLGFVFIIFSLKELFSIDFSYEIYGKIFIAITGFFFTPVFLSNIEEKKEGLFSKFLEFLLLKVIFPLLILYIFILYAYILKIIFNKIYPKNIVPYLTLFYALGASFFYYTTKLLENKYLQIFRKYFFYTIIPLVIMTYFSIIPRVKQYSLTENRYFIILSTLWLTLLIIFTLFSKKSNTIFFKNSFLLLLFLSSLGPLSSVNLSKFYQKNSLSKLLKLPKNNKNSKKIYEILYYFQTKHELSHSGFGKNKESISTVMNNLGYKYEDENSYVKNWYNFQGKSQVYDIKDFDYFIPNLNTPQICGKTQFELDKNHIISIKEANFTKNIPISELAKEFVTKTEKINPNDSGQIVYDLQIEVLIPEINKKILIIFKDLNFNMDQNKKLDNLYYEFYILVKNTK